MINKSDWDWNPGTKIVVDSLNCPLLYVWREEPQVSPDGEKIASVINTGDYQFSVCENLRNWDVSFEKVWGLHYSPDGRLTAIVMQDDEWTICVDGQSWKEKFDYVWDIQFSSKGKSISAAIQKELRYGMCVNDQQWPELYINANNFTLSPDGNHSCAVIQTRAMEQADIFGFQQGCYSIAVDGKPWDSEFVNVWTPVFHPAQNSVAAQCRTSLYDYTIVENDRTWNKSFSSVWRPAFNPATSSVAAPVRDGKHWALAQDGEIVMKPGFVQMWHLCFSPTGHNWAVVAAPEFGKWTVAVGGIPWKTRFDNLVHELTYGPLGDRVAAVGKTRNNWHIVVDGQVWAGSFDMAWKPVFSPNEKHAAAKVEKRGKYSIIINGKVYPRDFSFVWDPVFNPDSSRIMIRGIVGHQYVRIIDKVK